MIRHGHQSVSPGNNHLRIFITTTILLLLLVLPLAVYSRAILLVIGAADTSLFLWLNSCHASFWDPIMYWSSDKVFWFPLYGLLIFLIWKKFGSECWQPLLIIFLLILFTDQISSHLIKNMAERKRPSHEPLLIPLIHLSEAGPGGLYGFISSHAANAFALVVIIPKILKPLRWWLAILLLLWASLVSYSRIYNGVHYPADVVFAAMLGILSGLVFYYGYRLFFYSYAESSNNRWPALRRSVIGISSKAIIKI